MFIENTEIYCEENFLTQDELDFLDQVIADNQSVVDAFDEVGNYKIVPTHMKPFVTKLSYRVQNIISENYDKKIGKVYERNELQLLKPGDEISAHDDAEAQNVLFGAFIYITDENSYLGGELHYPKLGLNIKPKRGSLIIVPREDQYTHAVTKVENGNRFILVMLVSGD